MPGTLLLLITGWSIVGGWPLAAQRAAAPAPIIDVHLHALPAACFGPPPVNNCARAAFPPDVQWT